MNLSSVFSRKKVSDTVRGVHLYFSTGSVIVAAIHRNMAGVYYEQSDPTVLPGTPSAAQLGDAFRIAFDKFSIRDANLREARKSEWPAFRASGIRSVKEFERSFRAMSCYGLNASNAVVRAAIAHPSCPDIELSTSFNPLQDAAAVGESLMRLRKAADLSDPPSP